MWPRQLAGSRVEGRPATGDSAGCSQTNEHRDPMPPFLFIFLPGCAVKGFVGCRGAYVLVREDCNGTC